MNYSLMHQQLYVISAPSGAGKSTLVRALCALDANIKLIVSHTTRQPRINEVAGQDYIFISTATFEQMIADKQFLEYAIVYGNYYGTSLAAVQSVSPQELLLEIDWQGALQIRKLLPQAKLIFIAPPNIATLANRLRLRSTDSEETINTRIHQAQDDLSYAQYFDYTINNIDFNIALIDLYTIIKTIRIDSLKS